MELKHYFKLGMVLLIIFGLIIGAILFILGEIDDAPGLCLVGIILFIGLMFIEIIKSIKKLNG